MWVSDTILWILVVMLLIIAITGLVMAMNTFQYLPSAKREHNYHRGMTIANVGIVGCLAVMGFGGYQSKIKSDQQTAVTNQKVAVLKHQRDALQARWWNSLSDTQRQQYQQNQRLQQQIKQLNHK